MPASVMFHEGNRRLQDQFDSRRISDRLEEKLTRDKFTEQDRAFIEGAMVRVTTRAIFPNCPRYIVTPGTAAPSKYAPRPDYEPPEPAWKGFDDFRDYVHPRQKTSKGQ